MSSAAQANGHVHDIYNCNYDVVNRPEQERAFEQLRNTDIFRRWEAHMRSCAQRMPIVTTIGCFGLGQMEDSHLANEPRFNNYLWHKLAWYTRQIFLEVQYPEFQPGSNTVPCPIIINAFDSKYCDRCVSVIYHIFDIVQMDENIVELSASPGGFIIGRGRGFRAIQLVKPMLPEYSVTGMMCEKLAEPDFRNGHGSGNTIYAKLNTWMKNNQEFNLILNDTGATGAAGESISVFGEVGLYLAKRPGA
ncbi:hypothetical protein T440DRAFT_516050 [Plenodomus tracheiphilus IPT5]|uniref:Uncharacterized protein n=1 Tax=Plenodomus tracheiphilus IPT5 TaxID=1408161 RepID=A0A6A7BB48_9PLEO|nr:hypothetical protein T440DRAFT_516050 [Plenodomus tracheiphilus IPT5]